MFVASGSLVAEHGSMLPPTTEHEHTRIPKEKKNSYY